MTDDAFSPFSLGCAAGDGAAPCRTSSLGGDRPHEERHQTRPGHAGAARAAAAALDGPKRRRGRA